MKSAKREHLSAVQTILVDVSAELRALAYLFENQGKESSQFAALDMSEVSRGLGRILNREVRWIHRANELIDRL
jgi:hypothetical protein